MLRKVINLKKIIENQALRSNMHLSCIYPKGYTIAYEGDFCEKIGIIETGRIELIHHTYDGTKVVLGRLNQYDVFGDFLIHSHNPVFPGDLVVTESASVIYIDKIQLDKLLEQSFEFRVNYLRNLSQKALDMHTRNKITHQPTLRNKIIFWLENAALSSDHGIVSIESKEQLASLLNVRRPSLSRVLSEMKKEGIIDYNRKSIWVQQPCVFNK